MSTIAATDPAALTGSPLTGTSRAFDRNRVLVLDEISGVFQRVDPAEVGALVTELRLADRIFVTGAGRSGLVLKMAAMRLMHLGLTVHVVGETTSPAIRAGDLLLAASGSGTTAGVVKAAETAVAHGARVAAYTTSKGSPLAGAAAAVVADPCGTEDGPRLGGDPAVLGEPLRAGAVRHHRGRIPKPVGRGRCRGRRTSGSATRTSNRFPPPPTTRFPTRKR
jgi:6-phospho-3-hexuloisomerase